MPRPFDSFDIGWNVAHIGLWLTGSYDNASGDYIGQCDDLWSLLPPEVTESERSFHSSWDDLRQRVIKDDKPRTRDLQWMEFCYGRMYAKYSGDESFYQYMRAQGNEIADELKG